MGVFFCDIFFAMENQQIQVKKLPAMPDVFRRINANVGLFQLVTKGRFNSVLDIGSGAGEHAKIFEAYGKTVTRFDFGKSRAFDAKTQSGKTIIGDYLHYDFEQSFDCVWASHVLEHTVYTHEFLVKIRRDCKPKGLIAITVPPAKSEFVGGHVTLWTPALLLYRMVLAGIDCRKASVFRYGYNITVITGNRANNVVLEELAWDFHDIERLQKFFPADIHAQMNGDLAGDVYQGAQVNLVK
ncbi:MAG: class I SAM-dependent methyltransferase [Pseudomonadales bacterium]